MGVTYLFGLFDFADLHTLYTTLYTRTQCPLFFWGGGVSGKKNRCCTMCHLGASHELSYVNRRLLRNFFVTSSLPSMILCTDHVPRLTKYPMKIQDGLRDPAHPVVVLTHTLPSSEHNPHT